MESDRRSVVEPTNDGSKVGRSQNLTSVSTVFLEHCRIAKGLSTNTLRAYESDLAHARRILGPDLDVTAVDRDSIRRYAKTMIDDERRKETTAKRRLATLKVLFRWLEREEIVALSVFHRLDLSIRLPKRLPRALEADEMGRLLRVTESSKKGMSDGSYERQLLHFVVVTLFTTGLRIGELVAVRTEQVSVREGAVNVRGKGNRERRVYLPGQDALAVLAAFARARKRIRTDSDCFLVTSNGLPVTAGYVRKRLRRLAVKAKITRRVTPHMLRHTAATQLLEAGVDIRFVQRLLGHASIATTQIYTQVRDTALKAKLVRANTFGRLRKAG